jgi:hypothetical protein
MVDILSEDTVTLTDASKIIPGRPHSSTIWRWHQHGCRGVKLETVVIGGRRFTSREAIKRFIAKTTAARDGDAEAISPTRRRQAAIEKADAELEAAGI